MPHSNIFNRPRHGTSFSFIEALRNEVSRPMPTLNPAQEQFLVQWILEENQLGHPPDIARVLEMGGRIRRISGNKNKLGRRFIDTLINRYPQLDAIIRQPHDELRIAGAAAPSRTSLLVESESTLSLQLMETQQRVHRLEALQNRDPSRTWRGLHVVSRAGVSKRTKNKRRTAIRKPLAARITRPLISRTSRAATEIKEESEWP
jgi:hypothetical protein